MTVMKIVAGIFLCLIALGLSIALGFRYMFIGWGIENDVNAPLNRAQVAAEAEDMLKWMMQVEKGMQKRGMTEGYATILKHTPDYDYAAIYKSVQNIITRLGRTVEMDKSSVEYQTAVDDIRGACRELDLHVYSYRLKHYWGSVFIGAPLLVILWIVALVILIWGVFDLDL